MNTTDKISALRKQMQEAGIQAYIIPGTDPHASEYLAEHWKDRSWFSGFTGSAGTLVVGLEKAALWTDSRYFLQAEAQLTDSGIDLMKQGMPNTPDIIQWLQANLPVSSKTGINTLLISVNVFAAYKQSLQQTNISLVDCDLTSKIRTDRPGLSNSPCYRLDLQYAGKSSNEKLEILRCALAQKGATVLILSALDDIAWLFNIRGNDIAYNPVSTAYAMISMQRATLFIDPEKIDKTCEESLRDEGVDIQSYTSISHFIRTTDPKASVLFDGNKLNQSLYSLLPHQCTLINEPSIVSELKSIKNDTEIAGFRRAMIKDGIALTRFFKWLEENLGTELITEISADKKLTEFRSAMENFKGLSFETISAYAAHGAIVHYAPSTDTDATLQADGLFLIDSGCQFTEGTTDITRTISLGEPSEKQRKDFTLVLKGNIALSSAVFPTNTRGCQLDVLARQFLWASGLNYGHGTGHGVGHFLNVHEGPQSIRQEENPTTLKPGMVLSNEPALYRRDEYGIRTENLLLVTPAQQTGYGDFLQFEVLTLCYIDQKLIDNTLLTDVEVEWINRYHQELLDKLCPYLNTAESEWLKNKCAPITRK